MLRTAAIYTRCRPFGGERGGRIMMRLERIGREEMPEIYAAMQQNFISDELRDYRAAMAVLDDGRYGVYHIVSDGVRLGFICIWNLKSAAFVEHFVIYEPYRGKGVGGEAIDCVCGKFGKVILEVEKPEDDVKRRRIAFYQRHGFAINPQPYAQPAYRPDSAWVPMHLMSFPAAADNFGELVSELYEAVYHVKYTPTEIQ